VRGGFLMVPEAGIILFNTLEEEAGSSDFFWILGAACSESFFSSEIFFLPRWRTLERDVGVVLLAVWMTFEVRFFFSLRGASSPRMKK